MANSIRIFFFLIFSFLSLYTPRTLSRNQIDLPSLLALKKAIDDPKGSLNSWNETTNLCSWKGIKCGAKQPHRVVAINLHSQDLSGPLLPHIGNLSFLRSINFQNNNFHGQIPQEIGLLRQLEFVKLRNNSFSGIIPQNLSKCQNLTHLDLIDNSIYGVIPSDLGLLYKLEFLGLSKNKLSGSIPQSIGNLTSLRNLSLASCGLKGEIPQSLVKLQRLRFLDLEENNLTSSIHHDLFNISTIEYFVVAYNGLEGSIPSTIGLTLPNLRHLSLPYNRFSGHIPVSLSNVSSLVDLILFNNYFTGPMPRFGGLSQLECILLEDNSIEDDISFISSFLNCTNLKALGLGENLFIGSIPENIGNLSRHIYFLRIFNTQVHGKIPSGIGNLVGLTILELFNTNLEGPIPLSIGKITNLRKLNLGGNRLANVLPYSLGNLSLLNILRLGRNNFFGSIPKSFGNFTNLLELDLSHNNLSGPIPQDILGLSSISIFLNLSHNAFTGSIPNEVGLLTNLANLDLSNNKLSGIIPNSLETCTSLEQLYLQGNNFRGQIPQGLSYLKGLQDLDLSQNNLSGPIPRCFIHLHPHILNLSFNRLHGEVPSFGVFRNRTLISLEGNEELCGGVLELNLPPCPSSNSSDKNTSTLLKIVIPIAGVAGIFLCLVIVLSKRRTTKKNLSFPLSFISNWFLRFTYKDLLRATGGFSKDNLAGVGRFASVYKGILKDGQTSVAVKVLNLVVQGASKSFMAECNVMRGIRHRNLVKILSICDSIDFQGNDFKALVYEFKANGSLEKWLHNNTTQQEDGEDNIEISSLNMIQRLDIAIDVAEALEYLHNGTNSIIVHGDLKPSNILLDEDMIACVGDFGLAKIISNILPPLHERSSTIEIKGTIGYVPPEYGTNNSISTKGDTYSYGILLLEIFTNRRPTDDSFKDYATLHSFVSAALPNCILEIVDPHMLIGHHMNKRKAFENCMTHVLSIGVSCSKETPKDRMSMIDVVNELRRIKGCYVAGNN